MTKNTLKEKEALCRALEERAIENYIELCDWDEVLNMLHDEDREEYDATQCQIIRKRAIKRYIDECEWLDVLGALDIEDQVDYHKMLREIDDATVVVTHPASGVLPASFLLGD